MGNNSLDNVAPRNLADRDQLETRPMLDAAMEADSGMPNWTGAVYCSRFDTLFVIKCFGAMFSDGRNTAMYDRAGVRRDTDMGA